MEKLCDYNNQFDLYAHAVIIIIFAYTQKLIINYIYIHML